MNDEKNLVDEGDNMPELHAYALPVPAHFRHALLGQLARELPVRPCRTWWLATAAAIAAAVGLTLWVAWPQKLGKHPEVVVHLNPMPKSPAPPATIALADTSHQLGNFGLSMALDFPTAETQVSMAPLILRARIAGWTDTTVEYAVERVIYGTFKDKTIQQDMTYGDKNMRKSFMDEARKQFVEKQNRQPTDDELLPFMLKDHGIEKDREVIMLLQPRKDGGYQSSGMMFDAPPDSALDKREAEIVQILRDGGYLENIANPGEGDMFQMKLRNADAIVRAKVIEVTDTVTRWQVEKVLQGKDITDILEINHDLFRRRAEAVVNFAALKDDTLKDPAKREARITAEMKAMIAAEIAPQREAILFLGNISHEANTTRGELQYRMYDTSKRMTLDELEKLIAQPQSVEIRL